MTSLSSSLFRHHHHYTQSFITIHRRFTATTFRPLTITSSRNNNNNSNRESLTARKHQQPKPNKHLLKARDNVKHFSSTSLSPSLTAVDDVKLSPDQAVGKVASAQANFMRVVIQPNVTSSSSSSSSSLSSPEGLAENSMTSSSFSEDVGEDLMTSASLSSKSGGESVTSSSEGVTLSLLSEGGGGGEGVELLCVVRSLLKKIKRRVLVGDKVLVGSIDWKDRRGVIENVFERKTEVLDPPVANVDHLLVLFSLEQPKPEEFSLTRFLVEAESTRIPVTLALNKAELVNEETVTLWKSKLRSWGYEPIICSVETKSGLDSLQFYLRDRTSVIVGPSGVGKSSLINALRSNHFGLLPAEVDGHFNSISGSKWLDDQRVGEVSARSGRGKHTTRHVSLLPLSGGGYVADTPGFSLPSLLKVTKQSLPLCFPEIREILSGPSRCAFHNCLHIWEPECIVKTDWERYPYYLQLFDEIRIREEFQLRTLGTKREGDVRYKAGDMGVMQAEPRLEPKKHRRQSRKKVNQSLLHGLDEALDEDDDESYLEDDPIIRAAENEKQ
ncbi:EngC GTPase [Artemisia annua]|uniref:EngC GTPase n=1 Tax=Artemisia annua TaxID=35608 RepID=A0A2U1KN39_ARTAN|nr:EngC GTPase [Artemisia annua]